MHDPLTNKPSPIPALIYGTAWKKKKTQTLVEEAVKQGFRAIDTACQPKHYHEEGVGKALHNILSSGILREELYIQTKFTPVDGQDPQTVPYNESADIQTQVTQSCEVSLKNLQTNYLDALLLHSPIFPYAQMLKAWRTFENLYTSGSVKRLGISNCYDLSLLQKLYDDAVIKPTIVQNRFYDESSYDHELRLWCKDKHITYQSFWSLTANPHILAATTLTTLARTHQKSPEQIFFRYLNQRDIVPLTGTSSSQHMAEDLNIFDFLLNEHALKSIDALLLS